MDGTDLEERLACVQRSWIPRQRLHVGDVAWAAAGGDGSPAPDVSMAWGEPLAGFADVWSPAAPDRPGRAVLHLGSGVTGPQRAAALDEVLRVAPLLDVDASPQDPVLAGRGFRQADGPWFVRLGRNLDDLSDLDARVDGYAIRAVRPGELTERVEVHRRCWAPARIKTLLGLPVTGTEPGSGYSLAKHHAVLSTPVYRPELDLVAVAPDGSFAAFALGWLDAVNGCVLFEPIGTDPAHARRGLARALCSEILRVARDLGATRAIVSARGDDGYPVPRRLYLGLGMREVARFVPMRGHR